MKSLYNRLWRWHFFAAMIVIPFVLWQSVTGTLYLWSEWWMDQSHPQLRFVTPTGQPLPVSTQIRAALAFVGSQTEAGPLPPGPLAETPELARPSSSDAAGPQTETPELARSSSDAVGLSLWASAAADDAVLSSPKSDAHAGHHGTVDPARGSGFAVQRVLLPDDPTRSTTLLFQPPGKALPFPVFVNPYTATVLGQLSGAAWLPGISRALHGGWPLGEPGSWLLELGDGWAILMLATGLYLWWPRGRGMAALWPRTGAGTRVLLRDLHSCVAVWFSVVFLFFLISALPWTAFWGGKLLRTIESNVGQSSPAGFSPGGASLAQLSNASLPIELAVAAARRSGVQGTLDIRLAPWKGAQLFMTNLHQAPSLDRTLTADPNAGNIHGDYTNADIPTLPRLVALGIHVHQADFGPINIWLNTSFATSLIWLSVTGVLSWWNRRPAGNLGAPPKANSSTPTVIAAIVVVACVLMPLFGLSILLIVLAERAVLRPRVARATN